MRKVDHEILKLVELGLTSTTGLFEALPEDMQQLGLPAVQARLGLLKDAQALAIQAGSWRRGPDFFSVMNLFNVLAASDSPAPPSHATAQKVPVWSVRPGQYDGAELRATCHRPGAYDFLAAPSLRGGVRVPHSTAYLAVNASSYPQDEV